MFLKTSMKSLVLYCIVLICFGSARSGSDISDYDYVGTFDTSVEQESYRTDSDELKDDGQTGSIRSKGVSNEYKSNGKNEKYRSPYKMIKYYDEGKVTNEICDAKQPKCRKTNGACEFSGEKKIICKCSGSKEYSNTDGCGISDDICKKDQPKCLKPNGTCEFNDKNEVICKCSNGATFSDTIGCGITNDICDAEQPKCLKTNGTCEFSNGNEIICKCSGGTPYSKTEGCGIKDEYCKTKFKGCIESKGKCQLPDGETSIQCVCPENMEYQQGKGCKVKDEYCKTNFKECIESKGNCQLPDGKTSIQCVCPENMEYEQGKGCKVKDEYCKTNFKECIESKGNCQLPDGKTSIQCVCPENMEYQQGKGCKVDEATCNKFSKGCRDTGGECEKTENNEIKCVCPKESVYESGTGCKVTEEYCSKQFKECKTTGGDCKMAKKEEKYIPQCICPQNSTYSETGCKVTEDYCSKTLTGCKSTGGDCKMVKKEEKYIAQCICPEKSTYASATGCTVSNEICQTGKPNCLTTNGTCKLNENGQIQCICLKHNAYEQDKGCKADLCVEKCNVSHDATSGSVKCNGGPFGNVKCECTVKDHIFDENDKNCKADKCRDECGVQHDTPSDTIKCEGGPFGDIKCKCVDEKLTFDSTKKSCTNTCKNDGECSGGKKCINTFCHCEEGFSGKDCKILEGCKYIEKICTEADAECVYDKDAVNKSTCKCNHEAYYYDPESKTCKELFCKPPDPCKSGSKCSYDKDTSTGRCICPDEGKYYNYKTEKCEEIDLCILKKCGENKICEKGTCKCAGEDKNGTCVVNPCNSVKCFEGGVCQKDLSCACESGYFYDGVKCAKDAACVSDIFKTNCTCPKGMKRETGQECVAENEKLSCQKSCGFGFCMKDSESSNGTCKCVDTATLDKDTDFCIPDEQKVCGIHKLDTDLKKCNCTGKYTQADNGITCRLITCNDAVAKEDCKSKGATCSMRWTAEGNKPPGYECACPTGYIYDEDGKKCTDPCSLKRNLETCHKQGKICFNTKSNKNEFTGDCRCPPSLKEDGNEACSEINEHTYIIKDIVVFKKKYMIAGEIDKVSLNADLIKSMEDTFSSGFQYGYLQDYQLQGENSLNCSVWVSFQSSPMDDLKKLYFQVEKLNTSNCEECEKDLLVWPPNLLLSENNFKQENYKQLTMCSEVVKNSLCGTYANCKKGNEKYECFCGKGYRPVMSSFKETDKFVIQTCEDIDECASSIHSCKTNTTCVNTPGDYRCECKPGFKKGKISDPKTDKSDCTDLCSPSPCDKGSCSLKAQSFDCQCQAGYGGSLCDKKDEHYASAKHSTVVVGAVLGTILGVGLIAFLLFYKKTKTNSGSGDFMPAPRMDHAEMAERRPVRGVVNKSYE